MNMASTHARKITDEIIDKKTDIFQEAHREHLYCFLQKTQGLLECFSSECPDIQCHTESILRKLGVEMLNALSEICLRTLLGRLYEKKPLLHGQTPEERYRCFVEQHLLGAYDQVFSPGSQLLWLVEHKINSTVAALEELLLRLKNDRNEIRKTFRLSLHQLNALSSGLGDTHNHGRCVYMLEFDGEEKFLYKPHTLINDVIYQELQSWFLSSGRVKTDLRHIPVISKEEYGWQSYVHHEACQDAAAAERYMYRLGCLLFISYLTGSNDLHFDNLIAAGEYPVIIDTETLFCNRSVFRGIAREKMNGWTSATINSVFSSLLLPMELLEGRGLSGADISGILGGSNPKNSAVKIQALVGVGTDEMGFGESEQEVVFNKKKRNLAVLNGRSLSAADYADEVLAGFRDAYRAVMENKEAFRQHIERLPLSHGVYRQLFRNTNLYSKYLMAVHHPNYLEREDSRRLVFSRLKGKRGYISPEHEQLVECEIRQLMQEDVPSFYARYDDTTLYSVYGDTLEDFFGSTIDQQFQSKIQDLSDTDLYRQSYFIRCSLSPHPPAAGRYQKISGPAAEGDLHKRIEDILCRIYQYREDNHRVTEERNFPLYFNVTDKQGRTSVNPEAPFLYTGAGSALYYLQMQKMFGETCGDTPSQLVECSSLVDSPFIRQFAPAAAGIGLFSGIGSRVYLNHYAYKMLGQDAYLQRMNQLCQAALEMSQAGCAQTDVMSGYAGLTIFSLTAWEKDRSLSALYDLGRDCALRLLECYRGGTLPHQSGLAHGYAGCSTALILAGTLTGNKDCYDAGIELVDREQAMFVPESNSWLDSRTGKPGIHAWCYGAGGILAARTLALEHAEEQHRSLLERDVLLCVEILKRELMKEQALPCLCHGTAGHLDVLLWYAARTNDTSLLDFVREQTVRFLDVLQQKGICCERPAEVTDISFMLGLTGVGYYLLRFLDPTIPSVLAMESM